MSEARRLRTLEHENARLKRLVADLTLDNQALKTSSEKRPDARGAAHRGAGDLGEVLAECAPGVGARRVKLPSFRLYDLRHTYASLLLAGGAPITYVSAQLGHANPTTTLRYYARWIPSKGRRWVDLLDRAAGFIATRVARVVPQLEPIWNQNDEPGTSGVPEVPARDGGPSRTRTLDPLIKSQLLYQLS